MSKRSSKKSKSSKPPFPRRRRKPKSLKKPEKTEQKKISKPKSTAEIITGTLRLHARGFGFVIPAEPAKHPQDIFIPKQFTENAVDGDVVEVEINPRVNLEKGPEGRILQILKRGHTHLAGIILPALPTTTRKESPVFAHIPLLGSTRKVIVQPSDQPVTAGDRVILEVIKWGGEDSPTVCVVTQKMGNIEDPSCDVPAAIKEFDLRHLFLDSALEQAKKMGNKVLSKDLKDRLDLTKETCVTIDPETAKDFDDALSIQKNENGGFQLGVHIADVAYYVPFQSPLDQEASLRGNSTYFPGYCLPMLPHVLSDELCSLKQDVVRLTISVLMTFDQEGTLLNSRVERSFIKSKKRFTYGEAKSVLDGQKKSPFLLELQTMVELCQLLKTKRHMRGSIDFALPDLVIQVNEKGRPLGVKIEEYDITHQLVEEFMLKANEVVATTLTNRGKTLLYRVHEKPSNENMEDFFAMARALGFTLPVKPDQADIQKLFERAKTTPFSQQLAVGFIRNMKLATYSPNNVGHFGLGLEYYCHFTSPIRRYSDLITQRLLFTEEEDNVDLSKVALKCSDQERLSFRAESSVKLLKKLRLLKEYMEEDPTRSYTAIITRIKPFGLSFEMQTLFLEGFLHISELENDYFTYEPKQPALVGKRSKKSHVIGNQIQVRPLSIDLINLESKWELITEKPRR